MCVTVQYYDVLSALIQVYVDGVLCGQVTYSSSTSVYEIQCRLIGRVVKIAQETTTKPLTLCEVKAFGNTFGQI